MPYTAGPFDSLHWYLQWGGKLPGGEQWSCGVRMAGTFTYTTAKHTAMKDAIQAFHVNTNTGISAHAKLSSVKLNGIDTTGHYASSTTNEIVVADVAGGITESVPGRPNQVAWAVGLTTGFSRGPAHKGRFYVPMPTAPMLTTGLVNSTYATNLKGTAQTLLAALNAVDGALQVAVFSRKSGAAAHRAVTGIQVGQVLDTQRRRRRSLLETYI